MSRQVQKDIVFLNGKAATGIGNNVFVADFRNADFSFATAGNANLTIKVQGAVGETCPDFGSAQSATNAWDYVQVVDLQNGNPVDGDSGISVAGVDDVRLFAVNIDSLDWLNCVVTAYAAGNVTVKATLTDNL